MTDLVEVHQDSQPDLSPLIDRLHLLSGLGEPERTALKELFQSSEWLDPGAPIVVEGETLRSVVVLTSGMAGCHKSARSGRRQIIALLVRGDLCGDYSQLSHPMHFAVSALTRVCLARVGIEALWDLLDRYPLIGRALRNASLVQEAILRAWVINLGQRPAMERLAHLLCELEHRMRSSGLLISHDQFALPLNQGELGSALGMTSVHVNRVLQKLRGDQLIAFHSRMVRIKDLPRLHAIAEFDPTYLDQRYAAGFPKHPV